MRCKYLNGNIHAIISWAIVKEEYVLQRFGPSLLAAKRPELFRLMERGEVTEKSAMGMTAVMACANFSKDIVS
jgi:hypothetical protein